MHIDNVHKYLEYYVLCEDFNKSKVRTFNIFNHGYIYERLPILIKHYDNYKTFKKELLSLFKYCYLSKREWEIFIEVRDNVNKVSIYEQIEPNIDIIAKYVIEMYNKVKRKKLII